MRRAGPPASRDIAIGSTYPRSRAALLLPASREMLPRALLVFLVAPSVRAQMSLTAAGGISLTIDTDEQQTAQGFGYSLQVDGADWLASGPTAMTVAGKTYDSTCASADSCLTLDGKPTKTSGTDVRPFAPIPPPLG